MKNEELYDLSKNLKIIRNIAAGLSFRDLYGYHHMVDTSQKGFDCSYAKVMKRNGFQEKEMTKLRKDLNEIKEIIFKVEGKLDEEEERSSNK